LKDGKVNLKQLEDQFKVKPGDKNLRFDPDKKKMVEVPVKADAPDAAPQAPPQPDKNGLLEDVKRRQMLEEQRTGQLVDDAIRRANRLVQVDPEGAREQLK